jgi:hypothetical protein
MPQSSADRYTQQLQGHGTTAGSDSTLQTEQNKSSATARHTVTHLNTCGLIPRALEQDCKLHLPGMRPAQKQACAQHNSRPLQPGLVSTSTT